MLAESHYLDVLGPWVTGPRVRKGDDPAPASWVDVWLRRALRAEKSGYNVPHAWVQRAVTEPSKARDGHVVERAL